MSKLYVNCTGIRDGEVIVGLGKQCIGTKIRIGGFYPPSRKWVNEMSDVTIRDELGLYAAFRDMSPEQRRSYLLSLCVDNNDLYLDDVDLNVSFIAIGGEYFSKYPEICSTLLTGQWFKIKDVFNMFLKKQGSKARKHTLVFRPSNWTLSRELDNSSFNGEYVDLVNYTVGSGSLTPSHILLITPVCSHTSMTNTRRHVTYQRCLKDLLKRLMYR